MKPEAWEIVAGAVVLCGGWGLAAAKDRMRDGGGMEAAWSAAVAVVGLGGVAFSWMSGSSLPGAVGFVAGLALIWVVLPVWLIRGIRRRSREDGQGDGD